MQGRELGHIHLRARQRLGPPARSSSRMTIGAKRPPPPPFELLSREWAARASGRKGPGLTVLGDRAAVWGQPAPLPGSQLQLVPSPIPRPRARAGGRRAVRSGSPTLPGPGPGGRLARREENGVGCTYLGEFGAHQDEEQEAEELPGRLHVSRPPPTSWRAGSPGCSAAGGCVDADALPVCGLRGGARPCPRAFSTRSRRRAGSAARSLRSASPARRAAPRSPGGAGRPSAPPRPLLLTAPRPQSSGARLGGPGAKSLRGRGGGREAQGDPRATLTRGGGEGGGGEAGTGCDIKQAGEI